MSPRVLAFYVSIISEQTSLSMSFHFPSYSVIAPFGEFLLPNFNHLVLVGLSRTVPKGDIKIVDKWESTDTNHSEGSLATMVKQEKEAPG